MYLKDKTRAPIINIKKNPFRRLPNFIFSFSIIISLYFSDIFYKTKSCPGSFYSIQLILFINTSLICLVICWRGQASSWQRLPFSPSGENGAIRPLSIKDQSFITATPMIVELPSRASWKRMIARQIQ